MTASGNPQSRPIDFIGAYESYARDLAVLGEQVPGETSAYADLGGQNVPAISEAPLARFGYFIDLYLQDERKTDLRRGVGDLALSVVTIASLTSPTMDAATRRDYSAALTDYSNLLWHRSRQLRTPDNEASRRLIDLYGPDIDADWTRTYGEELTMIRNRLNTSALYARASMVDSGVSKATRYRRISKNTTGRWQLQETEDAKLVMVKQHHAMSQTA